MDSIARFLLPYLEDADRTSLSMVSRDILAGPPVSWIRKTIRVSAKRTPIDDCVSTLVIDRPNLSKLEQIVRNMPELNHLILVFRKPMLDYSWEIDLSFYRGTLTTYGFGRLELLKFSGEHISLPELE
jgi:hypothetical protein